jgi:alkylhydroperoxidase family enzyme
VRERVGSEKFAALAEFRTSNLFSERERAALAFAEEATLYRHVSDDSYAAVRTHFTETEIVELAWVNAAENYFNLQAHPLGIGSDELLQAATASDRA